MSIRLLHTNPFNVRRKDLIAPAGLTVAEHLSRAQVDPSGIVVYVGENVVPRVDWESFRPAAGSCIVAMAVPQGGDGGSSKVLRTVAMIAVAVVSAYTGNVAGVAASSQLAGAAAAASVMVAGTLLVNALIPPAAGLSGPDSSVGNSPTYALMGSRNQMRPFGVRPRLYGVHRFYPDLAAVPYVEMEGTDQYLIMLFDCGYGPMNVPLDQMKIGETLISNLAGVYVHVVPPGANNLRIYRNTMDVQDVNLALDYDVAQTVTTAAGADEVNLLLTFAGLVEFDGTNNRLEKSVSFEVSYRETGTGGSWLTDGVLPHQMSSGSITKTTDAGYRQVWTTADPAPEGEYITFKVPAFASGAVRVFENGTVLEQAAVLASESPQTITYMPRSGRVNAIELKLYEYVTTSDWGGEWVEDTDGDLPEPYDWVCSTATTPGAITITDKTEGLVRRMIRVALPDTSSSVQYDIKIKRTTAESESLLVLEDATLAQVQSITYTTPVSQRILDEDVLIELRIKATDALQGQLDQFSVLGRAILPVWNGAAWVDKETDLAAWAYANELRGTHNKANIPDSRIDLTTLQAWAQADTDAGRSFNLRFDFPGVIFDRLKVIAAGGRARPTMVDGKYSVIRDVSQVVPVQAFTPRNSRGFHGRKVFIDLPHAYRVRFINADKDWTPDERIVYVDSYTEETATKYDESLSYPGITDSDEIWKRVNVDHAQLKLRPEIYSFYADVESIRCTRGDLITVAHDVPMWGLKWGRIKSRTLSAGKTATITLDETVTMELGTTYAVSVRLSTMEVLTATVNTVEGDQTTLTFTTTQTGPNVGDLVMFGESDSVSADLLIKEIIPGDDLSAQIFAVDASPAVWTADNGVIPAFDSQITIPRPLNRAAPAVPAVEDADVFRLTGEEGQAGIRVRVSFSVAHSSGVLIEWVECRYRETGSQTWVKVPPFKPDTPEIVLSGLEADATYDIQLRAISTFSVPSAWSTTYQVAVEPNPFTFPDISGILSSDLANFEGRNDRNGSAVEDPTIAGDGSALSYSQNDDGTVNIVFAWVRSQDNATIDGFEVMTVAQQVSTPYNAGDDVTKENVVRFPNHRRYMTLPSVSPNRYYTFAVRGFRIVDPDVDADRVIFSNWVQPAAGGEDPYQPMANVEIDWAVITGADKPADGATKNTIYRQASPPDGEDGDIWYDTDAFLLYRNNGDSGGAWDLLGNAYDKTSQFTDDAGWSTTALWSGITGAGKPADNATANAIYRQALEPDGVEGDIWFDTVNLLLYTNDGAAWVLVGNAFDNTNLLTDGALLGETALWTGVTGAGRPADNATRNVIYRQTATPTSPAAGDIWYHPTTKLLQRYDGGTWALVANGYDNTNLLTDGASLGLTAQWGYVAGTGKPADNATENLIYRQANQPTGTVGDFWFNTTTEVLWYYNGSSWVEVGNAFDNTSQLADGANLGATAIWTSISGTGKPADGATKNLIYRQVNQPTGQDGDLWFNTTTKVLYRFSSGTWTEIGNGFDNTNLLTDGAGLGTTAVWASVTGTGKPADNATRNNIYRQTGSPSSPASGDFWYNPSTYILQRYDGASWAYVGNAYDNTNQLTDGASLGSTAVWTSVTGIGKPADYATRNVLYRQGSAPGSPGNGDLWYDTSTGIFSRYNGGWGIVSTTNKVSVAAAAAPPSSPTVGDLWYVSDTYLLKRWNGSSWDTIGNQYTNTNQLTDGAGLGTTATWTGVTGTGKPADNATKNTIYRQSTAPGSPGTGDLWYNTTTKLLLKWNGATWDTVGNSYDLTSLLTDDEGLGDTAIWSGVTGTGKPADNATVGAPSGTSVAGLLAEWIRTYAEQGQAAYGYFVSGELPTTRHAVGAVAAKAHAYGVSGYGVTTQPTAVTLVTTTALTPSAVGDKFQIDFSTVLALVLSNPADSIYALFFIDRSINGGAWTQIFPTDSTSGILAGDVNQRAAGSVILYRGVSISINDSPGTTLPVTYRVQAYKSSGSIGSCSAYCRSLAATLLKKVGTS